MQWDADGDLVVVGGGGAGLAAAAEAASLGLRVVLLEKTKTLVVLPHGPLAPFRPMALHGKGVLVLKIMLTTILKTWRCMQAI